MSFNREFEKTRKEIQKVIQRTLDSGWYILGEEGKEFEKEFSAYCETKHGIGVGSGTDAMFLALKAVGIGPGDQVIVPAHTFISTALAVTYTGAKPVFVDIEPDTYTIDPHDIRRKIASHTKAIIPVHLYGHPADMDPIIEMAEEHDLRLIEDACQAHGALYNGKKAGSIGDIGCFSFYPTKNLGAYGDGGMIVTNDEDIADKVRMLRNYGQREKHDHEIIGYNSRLDEVQAAILRVKLKHLDAWNDRRRVIAARYTNGLSDSGLKLPIEKEGSKHVYHLYVIACGGRNVLQKTLQDDGISTQVHYPTIIPHQECYHGLGYNEGAFPKAENLTREILSLPMFPALSDAEVDQVIEKLLGAVQGNGSETSQISLT